MSRRKAFETRVSGQTNDQQTEERLCSTCLRGSTSAEACDRRSGYNISEFRFRNRETDSRNQYVDAARPGKLSRSMPTTIPMSCHQSSEPGENDSKERNSSSRNGAGLPSSGAAMPKIRENYIHFATAITGARSRSGRIQPPTATMRF
jgi:hypothetical protein